MSQFATETDCCGTNALTATDDCGKMSKQLPIITNVVVIKDFLFLRDAIVLFEWFETNTSNILATVDGLPISLQLLTMRLAWFNATKHSTVLNQSGNDLVFVVDAKMLFNIQQLWSDGK